MTVLRKKHNSIYIEKPYPYSVDSDEPPFWTNTAKLFARNLVFTGNSSTYYEKIYISIDSIYGYRINENWHTITLLLKYNENELKVQFENQEEYDEGLQCVASLF